MTFYTVRTSDDLKYQVLLESNKDLSTSEDVGRINYPCDGFDFRVSNNVKNGENFFTIEYDGVKVPSRESNMFPNPTLAHFALASYIKKKPSKKIQKVLDMGCGSGFLGNYAGVKLNPEVVTFADLSDEALNYAIYSFAYLNNSESAEDVEILNNSNYKINNQIVSLRKGFIPNSLEGYDGEGQMALCAPMFIPGYCEVFPEAYLLFAKAAKNVGSDLYVGHSSLASHMVENAAEKMGSELEQTVVRTVPFFPSYFNRTDGQLADLIKYGLKASSKGIPCHDLVVSKLSY